MHVYFRNIVKRDGCATAHVYFKCVYYILCRQALFKMWLQLIRTRQKNILFWVTLQELLHCIK